MKMLKSALVAAAVLSAPALADDVHNHSDHNADEFQDVAFEVVDSHSHVDDVMNDIAGGVSQAGHAFINEVKHHDLIDSLSDDGISPDVSWFYKQTGYTDTRTGHDVDLGTMIKEGCLCEDVDGNKVVVISDVNSPIDIDSAPDFFNGSENGAKINNLLSQSRNNPTVTDSAAVVLHDSNAKDTVPIAVINSDNIKSIFNGVDSENGLNSYTKGAMVFNLIQHELFHAKDHLVSDPSIQQKAHIETSAEGYGYLKTAQEFIKDGQVDELGQFQESFTGYVHSMHYSTDTYSDLMTDMVSAYQAVESGSKEKLNNIKEPSILQFASQVFDSGNDPETLKRLAKGVNHLKSPYLFSSVTEGLTKEIQNNPDYFVSMEDGDISIISDAISQHIVQHEHMNHYFDIDSGKANADDITLSTNANFAQDVVVNYEQEYATHASP